MQYVILTMSHNWCFLTGHVSDDSNDATLLVRS